MSPQMEVPEDQWDMPCKCKGCGRIVELNGLWRRPGSRSGELELCKRCYDEERADIND